MFSASPPAKEPDAPQLTLEDAARIKGEPIRWLLLFTVMVSPALGSLLCLSRGGHRGERILVGFLPFLLVQSTMILRGLSHFQWRHLIAPFQGTWTLRWIGIAFLQLAVIEFVVLLRRRSEEV